MSASSHTPARAAADTPEMVVLSISGLSALLEDAAGCPTPAAARRLSAWLLPAERQTCASLRVAKRRRDWLAGRIAAKELVRDRHALRGPDCFQKIEIAALREGPERGRPFYRVQGEPGPYCLSLSHSGDTAVAALSRSPGQLLGVDHEEIASRDSSFEALSLSAEERRRLGSATGASRALAVTRCWVLKEALLKALGSGLRQPLSALTVDMDPRTGELADPPFLADSEDKTLVNHLTHARTRAQLFTLGERQAAWVVHLPAEHS